MSERAGDGPCELDAVDDVGTDHVNQAAGPFFGQENRGTGHVQPIAGIGNLVGRTDCQLLLGQVPEQLVSKVLALPLRPDDPGGADGELFGAELTLERKFRVALGLPVH